MLLFSFHFGWAPLSLSPLSFSFLSTHVNHVYTKYKYLHTCTHSIVFCLTNFYAPYFSYSVTPHGLSSLFIKYSHVLGSFLASLVYLTYLSGCLFFPANIMLTCYSNDSRRIFPSPAESASPGTLLQMQISGPTQIHWIRNWEGTSRLCFNKPPSRFWCRLMSEDASKWLSQMCLHAILSHKVNSPS